MSLNTWKELITQIGWYNMCDEDIKYILFDILRLSFSEFILAVIQNWPWAFLGLNKYNKCVIF